MEAIYNLINANIYNCKLYNFHYNKQYIKDEILLIKRRIEKSTPKRAFFMEQAAGIEPVRSAWEAEILPLNYACVMRLFYHV